LFFVSLFFVSFCFVFLLWRAGGRRVARAKDGRRFRCAVLSRSHAVSVPLPPQSCPPRWFGILLALFLKHHRVHRAEKKKRRLVRSPTLATNNKSGGASSHPRPSLFTHHTYFLHQRERVPFSSNQHNLKPATMPGDLKAAKKEGASPVCVADRL
jgi:hypothetical protein